MAMPHGNLHQHSAPPHHYVDMGDAQRNESMIGSVVETLILLLLIKRNDEILWIKKANNQETQHQEKKNKKKNKEGTVWIYEATKRNKSVYYAKATKKGIEKWICNVSFSDI